MVLMPLRASCSFQRDVSLYATPSNNHGCLNAPQGFMLIPTDMYNDMNEYLDNEFGNRS